MDCEQITLNTMNAYEGKCLCLHFYWSQLGYQWVHSELFLRCPGTLNCFVFISFWYWRCEVSKVTLVLHKSWYSRAYLVSPSYIYILNLQMSLFRKHSLINLMYSDVLCGTLKFKVKYLPIQLIGKQAAQINSQKWFTNNN